MLSELPAADLESEHPPESAAEPAPVLAEPSVRDTRQAAFASTVLAAETPPRRAPIAAPAKLTEPAAVAALPSAPLQPVAERVGHKQTLPFGFVRQSAPESGPSVARASRPDITPQEASKAAQPKPAAPMAESPHHEQPPLAAKRAPAHEPAKGSSGYKRVLVLAGASIGATVVGMGLAFIVRHPQAGERDAAVQRRAAETAVPVATPSASTPVAMEAAPVASIAPAPGTAEAATGSAIQPAAQAPSASSAPSSGAAVTAAPPAASAPAATTEPAPSAAPTMAPVAQPLPDVPKPSFDVNRLPPDRAALIVHSSAATHVFVHGVDYGETNQVLMTSCGTRFVRLGRALGDFIEPGAAHVLKCRRLTELTIEPPR
jgi:hypothetical protein